MKYINKILVFIGLLGCVSGLILCSMNKVDFGTWDIPAFIAGIVFFGLMTTWRSILTFIDDRFDIEYNKKDGLKLKEREGKE